MSDPKYACFMGRGPKQIPHWEHWSCSDAETYLTGIDYYAHPKRCREKLKELYPQLRLGVPATDDPRPRSPLGLSGPSSDGGNHIPWNIPTEAIRCYLDLSAELARRQVRRL